ncbi:MAG: protein kinase domain-containing protein [Planctomycetota bacterium]|jgi:serine/threonine-protein kinase
MPSSSPEDRADLIRDGLRRHESGRPAAGDAVGRYQIIEELGKGGMATVYRARDRHLDREVALKILAKGEGWALKTRHRFLREAQIAGSLSHPNLVSAFDIGEEEGRMYLVMELVDGDRLDKVLKSGAGDLDSRLQLLAGVARGMGAAHAEGVVHRDLKPGNVLIDRNGRPKVGDFGVAHLVRSRSRLTETGTLVGTPRYMAPEQVEGEKGTISPRTDVYAIGVMLYEILTGRPPFTADTVVQLHRQIVREDAVAPMQINAAVPRELEAVCLKAIDKEPQRRYADGAELGEEIERYLRGEAVGAGPSTVQRRIWRKLKRHRTAWALGTTAAILALAGLAVVAFLVIGGARQSRAAALAVEAERAYEAGEYDKTSQAARKALDLWPECAGAKYWLTRLKIRRYQLFRGLPQARVTRGLVEVIPARPETPLEKELREEMEKELAALRDSALAEGILALWKGDYARAVEKLESVPPAAPGSWEAEFYAATAHYLMGSFEKALEGLSRHRDRDPEATLPVYVRTLIAAAQARDLEGRESEELYMRAIGECANMEGETWRIIEALALTAWGTMEQSRGRDPESRYDDAIGALSSLEDPEARLALGYALLVRARYLAGRGRVDPDDPSAFDDAIAAFGSPSTAAGFLQRAEAYVLRHGFLENVGRATGRDLVLAHEDYRRVLDLSPHYTDAVIGHAQTARALVLWEQGRDDDAVFGAFDREIAALKKIIETHPAAAVPRSVLGASCTMLAHEQEARGIDPIRRYETALVHLARAVELNPKYGTAHRQRGIARQSLARYRQSRGGNPTVDYETAVEDFDSAIRINPKDVRAFRERSVVRQNLASFLMQGGVDAKKEFLLAIADLDRAIKVNPMSPNVHRTRGAVYRDFAIYRERRGEDPGAQYKEAIESLDRALRINPLNAPACLDRGITRQNLAVFQQNRGRDPTEDYEAAIADFARSIEINPANAHAYQYRGLARQNLAGFRLSRRQDALDLFRAAIADFDRAIELRPNVGLTHRYRGLARQNLAYLLQHGGVDSTAEFEAAIADFGRAFELNPRDAEAYGSRGLALQNLAFYSNLVGKDPVPGYLASIEDFGRAIRINPGGAKAFHYRGLARLNLEDVRKARGEASEEGYREAIRDFDQAILLNPANAESFLFRGSVRANLARFLGESGKDAVSMFEEAVADFTESIRVNPAMAAAYKRRGSARRVLAEYLRSSGEDPSALLEEALDDLDRSLKLSPWDAQAIFHRGSVLIDMGRRVAGLDDIRRAVELDPSLREAGETWIRKAQKEGR